MRLFYRKYGNGPPLIILHGLYGSSDNWITIARGISDRFEIILPDQRNHGLSPHSGIHDYEAMRDDLNGLAEDLGLEKFFLAGHSMGGKTAVSFALKWPEKISGLVIADISPFSDEKRHEKAFRQISGILNAILATNLKGMKSRQEVEEFLTPLVNSGSDRALIMKNLKRETDNSFTWKLNAQALSRNIGNILSGVALSGNDSPMIQGFPVYILKGERSDYLDEKDLDKIIRIFPAAEVINIKGAGHWIHTDNPDEVKKSLLRLLD